MKYIILLFLAPTIILGQKNISMQLDEYMNAQADIYNFSGVVLVKSHNKIVLEKAYGLADREWNIPNTLDTKYNLCSITKQFTATSILQLDELGKLNVNDKLYKYLPDFPNSEKVTIHMMLTHTAGLTDYTELPEYYDWLYALDISKDSIISILKTKPFDFEPGTSYKYSSSNYYLLAYVVEMVTKQNRSFFLKDHIFNKAGMINTGVDTPDTILLKRAKSYLFSEGKYISAETERVSNTFGTGDIFSTVEDLNKWDNALLGKDILSNGSKFRMYTPVKENYGYGIICIPIENKTCIQHSGSGAGFSNSFLRIPSDSSCVIVLSNNASQSPSISFALATIILGGHVKTPKIHTEIKQNSKNFHNYTGQYEGMFIGFPSKLKIIEKSDKLYVYVNGVEDIEIKAESPTRFYYANGTDKQIEFELDSKGKVINLWRLVYGLKVQLKKRE